MVDPDKLFGRLGNRMFQGAYLKAQELEGNVPDIYVQDPSLFDKHKDSIIKMYRTYQNQTDKVAIHVRRGDYVNNPFYVDLSQTDYYQRAMQEFPGAKFLVFSDDIRWCMKQDMFRGCEFYHSTEIDDMNKMSSCVGHIIANSSFSWWAAFISPYTRKIVAPKAWYSDGVERTKVPKEWTRI